MTLSEYMREIHLIEKQCNREEELYPLINILLRESGSMNNGLSLRSSPGARRTKKNLAINQLYGISGFPDLAILDEKYGEGNKNEWKEYMYGCVEAKAINEGLKKLSKLDKKYKVVIDGKRIKKDKKYKVVIDESIEIKKVGDDGVVKDGETEKVLVSFPKSGTSGSFGQLLGSILWYGKVIYTDGVIWRLFEFDKENDKEKSEETITAINKLFNETIKNLPIPPKDAQEWYDELKGKKICINHKK